MIVSILIFYLGLTIEEREELALLIAEEERLDLEFGKEENEDVQEEDEGILSQNDSLADSENFFETESSPNRNVESEKDIEQEILVENLNSTIFDNLKGEISGGEKVAISGNCDTDLKIECEDKKLEFNDIIEIEKSDENISLLINDFTTKVVSEEGAINKKFSSPTVEIEKCYSPLMRKEEEINIQVNPLRNLLSSAKKNEKKSDSNFSNSKSINFGNSFHCGKKTVKSADTENHYLYDEKNENSNNSVKNLILKFSENEMKKDEISLIEEIDGKNEMMSLICGLDVVDEDDKKAVEEEEILNIIKIVENPSDLLVNSNKKIPNLNPLFSAVSNVDEDTAWNLDLLATSPLKVRFFFIVSPSILFWMIF